MSKNHYTTPSMGGIFAPENGWKPSAYYIIEIAYHEHNPIHKSILYTGFLNNKGEPDSYNGVFLQGDVENNFSNAYYLRPIAEINMNILCDDPPFMTLINKALKAKV